MADLTRFDFHALRFIQSDSIAAMSNEEVGQYTLLLAEAWLSGKDATLPDNLEILARKARCKKVSDRVLAMFPIVQTEWGPRRQNETLHAEWVSTTTRIELASEMGRRGNEVRWGANRGAMGGRLEINRDVVAQTEPTQIDSNQTKPTSSEHGQSTFKTIALRYSSHFGGHHSHSKKHIEKYQIACQKYGEDKVLEYFERWAEGSKWLKEKRDSNGLNFFTQRNISRS